jgi:Na+-transporting NADH:ubiquinone oxidoreductase subunit NqrD
MYGHYFSVKRDIGVVISVTNVSVCGLCRMLTIQPNKQTALSMYILLRVTKSITVFSKHEQVKHIRNICDNSVTIKWKYSQNTRHISLPLLDTYVA